MSDPNPSPDPDITHSVTRSTAREKSVGLFGKLNPPTHQKRRTGSSTPSADTSRTTSPLPPYPPGRIQSPRISSPKNIPKKVPEAAANSSADNSSAKDHSVDSLDWDSHNTNTSISGQIIRQRDQYTSTSLPKERSVSDVLQNRRAPPISTASSEEDLFFETQGSRSTTPVISLSPSKRRKKDIPGEKEKNPTRTVQTVINVSPPPPPPSSPNRASGGSGQNLRADKEPSLDRSSVITVVPALNQAEAAAMAQEIAASKISIQKGLDYIDDEVEDHDNFDSMPLDDLKDTIKAAIKLKDDMSSAMAHLMIVEEQNYTANIEPQARETKKSLIKFIKKAQTFVKSVEDRNLRNKDALRDATLNIKTRRVKSSLSNLIHKADLLFTSLISVKETVCESDNDLRILLENYASVTKELEEFLKDVQSVYTDAVATGLEEEAEKLDKVADKLKSQRNATSKEMTKKKLLRGVDGRAGPSRARIKDLKPPLFSGLLSENSTDFFTFKTEFREYVDSQGNSIEEQVDLLRKTCLEGAARSIVFHMKTLEEIWEKLRSSYGDPTLLINHKMKELEKLGKCPEHGDKRRNWFIETHSKISRLLELSTEHKQEQELYHSPLVGTVRLNLPEKLRDEFKKKVFEAEKENASDMTKPEMFAILLQFLVTCVETETFNLRFDQQLAFKSPGPSTAGPKATEGMNKGKARKNYAAQQQGSNPPPFKGGSGNNSNRKQKPSKGKPNLVFEPQAKGPPKGVHCSICQVEHQYLYECKNFQKKTHIDRISLSHLLRVCFKCMRMDSRVYKPDMEKWFKDHEKNCETQYLCNVGNCQLDPNRPAWRRRHIVMCEFHSPDNSQLLQEFVDTLDPAVQPASHKFFFMESYNLNYDPGETEVTVLQDGTHVLPDVMLPSIYMVQTIPGKNDLNLLVFFDSGCSSASMSTRAYKILDCEEVRPGPTLLNVAGGNTLKIPYGDERFLLELEDEVSTKATISALRMDQVTSSFPYWPLQAAWDDLNNSYVDQHPNGPPLPLVDAGVGGVEVDIMLGIRYNQYFPVQLYMLPGGLAIYRAQFKTVSGNQGVLGGTHQSWAAAMEKSHFMGPAAYFTAELKAQQCMDKTLFYVGDFDDIHPDLEGYVDDVENWSKVVLPSEVEQEPKVNLRSDGVVMSEIEKRSEIVLPSEIEQIFFTCGFREYGLGDHETGSISSENLIGAQIDLPNDSETFGGRTASKKHVKKNSTFFVKCNFSTPGYCTAQHCNKHKEEEDRMYPEEWNLTEAAYNVLQDERMLQDIENTGTEVSYRCVTCRNCIKCKDSELQEKISLNEEVEQALLERSLPGWITRIEGYMPHYHLLKTRRPT